MDMRAFNASVITEFRENGGVVGGALAEVPLLLLTTVGARTGRKVTTPLSYSADGSPDRLVVFASNRGAERHPSWYHNLVAEPNVEVEVGTRSRTAVATPVQGVERERLHKLFVSEHPGTEDHQPATRRRIPLVILEFG